MIAPRARYNVPLPSGTALALGASTLVMGIVNVTPDSFSDGGLAYDPAVAVERALTLAGEGAHLLDLGAESTRPGAADIDATEEWRRLRPVLKVLRGRLRIPLSVDTYRAETARRALDEGADIINDISGLTYDASLGELVAARRAALVLMHTRGRSRDMYREAHYDNVVSEVTSELQRGLERALGAGVAWDRLIVDPGLGFAKTAAHSLSALAHIDRFAALGRPLLSGPSRKSFLNDPTAPQPAHEREWATSAAVTASVLGGAHIVRVHTVSAMVQVVRLCDALRNAA